MNPQKEIPVLDDDGFYLSESVAILQYLCNKYAPDSQLYPKDAKLRAVVDQRLCFNMAFYYSSISAYVVRICVTLIKYTMCEYNNITLISDGTNFL